MKWRYSNEILMMLFWWGPSLIPLLHYLWNLSLNLEQVNCLSVILNIRIDLCLYFGSPSLNINKWKFGAKIASLLMFTLHTLNPGKPTSPATSTWTCFKNNFIEKDRKMLLTSLRQSLSPNTEISAACWNTENQTSLTNRWCQALMNMNRLWTNVMKITLSFEANTKEAF